MPYFHLNQSTRHLTLMAGLMLVGHCLLVAQLDRLDLWLPKRGKIKMSDLVKSYLGLLTLGKSDFEVIKAFRQDRFFQEALGIRPGAGERLAAAAVGTACGGPPRLHG